MTTNCAQVSAPVAIGAAQVPLHQQPISAAEVLSIAHKVLLSPVLWILFTILWAGILP